MIGRHGTATFSAAATASPCSRGEVRREQRRQREHRHHARWPRAAASPSPAPARRRSARRRSRRRGTTAGSAGRSGARPRPPACWWWRRRRRAPTPYAARPPTNTGEGRGRGEHGHGDRDDEQARAQRRGAVPAVGDLLGHAASRRRPAAPSSAAARDSSTSLRSHCRRTSGSRVVRLMNTKPWVAKASGDGAAGPPVGVGHGPIVPVTGRARAGDHAPGPVR